jgi:hypothetical protein
MVLAPLIGHLRSYAGYLFWQMVIHHYYRKCKFSVGPIHRVTNLTEGNCGEGADTAE